MGTERVGGKELSHNSFFQHDFVWKLGTVHMRKSISPRREIIPTRFRHNANFHQQESSIHMSWKFPPPNRALREKLPNTEFFLVRTLLYSDWIRRFSSKIPNKWKCGSEKTPHWGTFHAVKILPVGDRDLGQAGKYFLIWSHFPGGVRQFFPTKQVQKVLRNHSIHCTNNFIIILFIKNVKQLFFALILEKKTY